MLIYRGVFTAMKFIDYLKELDKKMPLISLTYDRAFKSVFQRNRNLLIDYLNSCFYLKVKKNSKLRFLNTELPKENMREYQKNVDLYFVINEIFYIDLELNRMPFETVIDRNDLYMCKLVSLLLETGENIKKLKTYKLWQINLNANKVDVSKRYKVIPFDVIKRKRYPINRCMVANSLETYRKLYYTYGKRTREVIWNTALTATTFTELYVLLIQILEEDKVIKFMKDVIRMSNNNFILHEWEKDKLDELLQYNLKEYGRKEGIKSGRQESKIEIAKKLFKLKMSVEDISKVTGLSLKKVKSLM